jgi:hypothetical protein
MKQLLLGGAMLMAIAASGSPARAVPFVFTYTGSLVTFVVPTTATYQILAFGAQGGSGALGLGAGGRGAEIGGDFSLTADEVLQIAVGGAGSNGGGGGGGGGGSFVVGPGNAPLVIAGGGGGGGLATIVQPPIGWPGGGGLTGPDGGGERGGTGGHGGGAADYIDVGGGGGGFLTAGENGVGGGTGGGAFPDLLGGIRGGGFGGGGGGSGGGGGGGGYSGGEGEPLHASAGGSIPGFGGGSFDAGLNQILLADYRVGDGEVIITEIAAAVPEPSSVALVGAGFFGLTAVMWRRRRPEG